MSVNGTQFPGRIDQRHINFRLFTERRIDSGRTSSLTPGTRAPPPAPPAATAGRETGWWQNVYRRRLQDGWGTFDKPGGSGVRPVPCRRRRRSSRRRRDAGRSTTRSSNDNLGRTPGRLHGAPHPEPRRRALALGPPAARRLRPGRRRSACRIALTGYSGDECGHPLACAEGVAHRLSRNGRLAGRTVRWIRRRNSTASGGTCDEKRPWQGTGGAKLGARCDLDRDRLAATGSGPTPSAGRRIRN